MTSLLSVTSGAAFRLPAGMEDLAGYPLYVVVAFRGLRNDEVLTRTGGSRWRLSEDEGQQGEGKNRLYRIRIVSVDLRDELPPGMPEPLDSPLPAPVISVCSAGGWFHTGVMNRSRRYCLAVMWTYEPAICCRSGVWRSACLTAGEIS